jgi:hypothetical protein
MYVVERRARPRNANQNAHLARQDEDALLLLVGSLRMALLNFWIPVGLTLTSRAIRFFKADQGG